MSVIPADTKEAVVSSRLRKWRVGAGLTLTEVADVTGVSVAMMSRLERGQRHLRLETKVKLARRLGVRIADLFEVEPIEELAEEEAS